MRRVVEVTLPGGQRYRRFHLRPGMQLKPALDGGEERYPSAYCDDLDAGPHDTLTTAGPVAPARGVW